MAEPISFAKAFFRKWGIGDAQMRELRLDTRRGYISHKRLSQADELERETGHREPHWYPPPIEE